MEAKVDIRKLQMLNDRVSQMIEALNQVRLSVYGLSHTPALGPLTTPFGVPGFGTQPLFGYGVPAPIGFAGLQHTPPFQGLNPYGLPIPTFGLPGLAHTAAAPVPFLGIPPTPWFGTNPIGISHTPPEFHEQRLMEARASDPVRLAHTFPYFFAPYPLVL